MDQNKQKALAAALGQIEKQFGKGSIMRLGDSKTMDIEAISTGSLSLDVALGIGGLPCGRIVEIYGPESSGKTTLTLQVIAEAQKKGKTCAFVDAEHALDPIYAAKLGVNETERQQRNIWRRLQDLHKDLVPCCQAFGLFLDALAFKCFHNDRINDR